MSVFDPDDSLRWRLLEFIHHKGQASFHAICGYCCGWFMLPPTSGTGDMAATLHVAHLLDDGMIERLGTKRFDAEFVPVYGLTFDGLQELRA